MSSTSFVDQNNLWTEEQHDRAKKLRQVVQAEDLKTIRVAWADQHGISRTKVLTVSAFLNALKDGWGFNTAPITFDSAQGHVYDHFVEGGGFGMEEMTGCPNIILIPDPSTFRILPWTKQTGWILCDAYFKNGRPVPFCTRQSLKSILGKLHEHNYSLTSGLEVEWHLFKLKDSEPLITEDDLGSRGQPGRPFEVYPSTKGFQYHNEFEFDQKFNLMEHLVDHLLDLDLPLETIEKELGPGQFEFTFAPMDALSTADAMILFRTALKQLCFRKGYHATFMCKPANRSHFASGWHLHQSIVDKDTGENLFPIDPANDDGTYLSDLGRHYVGGVLEHSRGASVFSTPTVNGYKRLKPYSLAPDRVVWSYDNRGALLRVTGSEGDPSTHIENRIGDPAANPYLYLGSQAVAGIDGIQHEIEPEPMSDTPYDIDRPMLPKSLEEAVEALKNDSLFREEMGEQLVDYITTIKETEIQRFKEYMNENKLEIHQDEVTQWEQREYFEVF